MKNEMISQLVRSLLPEEVVLEAFNDAINNRVVLEMGYYHAKKKDPAIRRMAPFDRGSDDPNKLYPFCYDHRKRKTGQHLPKVHPIHLDLVFKIEPSGEHFNEQELADIDCLNRGNKFHYRDWHIQQRWGTVP